MSDSETEYYKICANRYLHPLPEGEYGEVHHILPRSLGGMDISQNLVKLTPEEHYKVHELLPFIYTEGKAHAKMVFAWWLLAHTREGLEISEEEYGALKRELASAMAERSKGNHYRRGTHHTEETRRKMSEAFKGRHFSEETKRKLSEAHKGRPGFWKGKHRSDETKRKMSEARKRYFENKRKEQQKCLGVA